MREHIESLQKLAEYFGRLQGVGKKSALRMAYSLLEKDEKFAVDFAASILEAKEKIHDCPRCGNLTDEDICYICQDENRDRNTICVVEDVKSLLSMEKVREYRGVYHVLHGAISPVNGITPDKLSIKELLRRIQTEFIDEVIIATNPTPDGEITALYLIKALQTYPVKLTRLAYGIPVGSDLEYADEVTLGRALEGRRSIY